MLSALGFRATAVHAGRRNSFTADNPTYNTLAPHDMPNLSPTHNHNTFR
jgi:hypothetical protein